MCGDEGRVNERSPPGCRRTECGGASELRLVSRSPFTIANTCCPHLLSTLVVHTCCPHSDELTMLLSSAGSTQWKGARSHLLDRCYFTECWRGRVAAAAPKSSAAITKGDVLPQENRWAMSHGPRPAQQCGMRLIIAASNTAMRHASYHCCFKHSPSAPGWQRNARRRRLGTHRAS